MKNQYFGDINDYKKYSLLRNLGDKGKTSTVICWLLTLNDLKPDGHRIRYLKEPERWRQFDPVVYDFLYKQVIERRIRRVESLESNNILPNCRFYSEIVKDNPGSREEYLQRFLEYSHGADLIFFDPDNGMEVQSIPFGRKNSSKYLYWTEVEKAYNAGHSLLVYQHLPPKPRDPFIRNVAQRFVNATGIKYLHLYQTQFAVFFLIPQSSQEALFTKINRRITEVWGNQIEVKKYKPI